MIKGGRFVYVVQKDGEPNVISIHSSHKSALDSIHTHYRNNATRRENVIAHVRKHGAQDGLTSEQIKQVVCIILGHHYAYEEMQHVMGIGEYCITQMNLLQ